MNSLTATAARRLPAPWVWAAGLLLLLYAAALWGGSVASAQWLGQLSLHGQVQAHAHGQPFADARAWLGLPNAADTLSNLPFLLLALWGWQGLRRRPLPAVQRLCLHVFFTGLLLTAGGSSLYHLDPGAWTLVFDRLGMAVAFAGLLALASSERLGEAAARAVLCASLPMALLAALLPALAQNLMPWLVVQFGGIAWVLAMALRRPVAGALGVRLGAVIAWYALAKVLEGLDGAVFAASAEWVSGHSLKHLAAAAAALPVLAALHTRRPGGDHAI